jgi:hypothetical protein
MAGRPPKEKSFANMLRLAISEAHNADGNKLRAVAQALVDKALTGDVPAIREIGDRIDGKVPQGIIGDDDSDPINIVQRIERVIVDANITDTDS